MAGRNELIIRGKRVVRKGVLLGIVCLFMTIPGILLYFNGKAWHMDATLVYGPLICAAAFAICSATGFLTAYHAHRAIAHLGDE